MAEFKHKDSDETIARRKANARFAEKRLRGLSNLNFSKKDSVFKEACENAGIQSTARQASKYRSKTGLAYKSRNKEV